MDDDGSFSHSTFGNFCFTFNQKTILQKLNTGLQANSLHWHAFPSFPYCAPAHNVATPNNFVFFLFFFFIVFCKLLQTKRKCGKIIILYLSTLFLLSEKSYKSPKCLLIINKYNLIVLGYYQTHLTLKINISVKAVIQICLHTILVPAKSVFCMYFFKSNLLNIRHHS